MMKLYNSISLFYVLTFSVPQSQCAVINTSSTASTNTPKPDLGCILFGDAGCQISCNVMCDMYGCQSNAECVREIYCDCNEIYEISSALVTSTDYNRLSFNKLWNYKIDKSRYADKVRQKIIQNPETFDLILQLLRDPHKTGIDIKKRLQEMNPSWRRVRRLQPKRLGHINDLMNEVEGFDDEGLGEYLETNMDSMIDDVYDRLQNTKHKARLTTVLGNLDEEEEIKYIIKQILLSKKDSLYDYASNFLQNKGYEVENLVARDDDVSSITADDVDQIILAGVLQKLINVKENPQDVDKQTFVLSDEMIAADDDLYDPDFDTVEDDVTETFVLSDEMTTTRDDLYDPEFDQTFQPVQPKKRKRRTTKLNSSRKKYLQNSNKIDQVKCKTCPYAYTNNKISDSAYIPDSSYSNADYNYDYELDDGYDYANEEYDNDSETNSNQWWNFWSNGNTDRKKNNSGWWSNSKNNGNVQSWNLGKSGITLASGPSGNTGMQWRLGKSSITLADDGRGGSVQSWDLGNSGVHLQQNFR